MAADDCIIRPLTGDDDLGAFGRLVRDSYVGLPDSPVEPDYEVELLDVAGRVEQAVVFGAFDGERPLGCITFVADASSPYAEDLLEGESSFRMLAVDAAARGRGVGEALTVRCIDEARSLGSQAVFIHSGTWMPTAHRLYGRLGFERVPDRDWQFDDPPFTLLGFRLPLGCPECGFDFERVGVDEVGPRLAAAASAIVRTLFDAPTGSVGVRPAHGVWSALEYASHVRDVLLTIRDRLVIGLVEHDPGFAPMYRDERIDLGLYTGDTVDDLAVELPAAAAMLTRMYAAVHPDGYGRPVRYGFPDPVARTVGWMGLQAVHESEHHQLDVGRTLDRIG